MADKRNGSFCYLAVLFGHAHERRTLPLGGARGDAYRTISREVGDPALQRSTWVGRALPSYGEPAAAPLTIPEFGDDIPQGANGWIVRSPLGVYEP